MGHELLVETDHGDRVLMLGRRDLLLEVAVEGGTDEASQRHLELMPTDDGCVLITVDPQLGLRLVVRWRVRPRLAPAGAGSSSSRPLGTSAMGQAR
jgi:hypothetical protein